MAGTQVFLPKVSKVDRDAARKKEAENQEFNAESEVVGAIVGTSEASAEARRAEERRVARERELEEQRRREQEEAKRKAETEEHARKLAAARARRGRMAIYD